MPRMGSANRRDPRRVARCRKPIVNGGADLATQDRRLARTMMARDEQDNAIPGIARAFQREIDGPPSAIETVAVEIDDPVGLERAGAELPVPCPVERGSRPNGSRFRWLDAGRSWRCRFCHNGLRRRLRRPGSVVRSDKLARQGADGRRYPSPELGFVRAE